MKNLTKRVGQSYVTPPLHDNEQFQRGTLAVPYLIDAKNKHGGPLTSHSYHTHVLLHTQNKSDRTNDKTAHKNGHSLVVNTTNIDPTVQRRGTSKACLLATRGALVKNLFYHSKPIFVTGSSLAAT